MKRDERTKQSGGPPSRERVAEREERRSLNKKSISHIAKNSVVDLRIAALDEDGYGTVRSESGLMIRVAGTLPGDHVLAGIDHVAKGNAFGHIRRLVNASPLRNPSPPCKEGAECLGCPLIGMKYEEQKQWKRGMILSEMAKYPQLADATVHMLKSPDKLIHYRTTAKLTIAGKFADPFIGIYRRSSHDVYDLEQCALHHPLINTVVEVVRAGIKKLKVPIYNPQSRMGLLRYLVVRVSEHDNRAMVVFVTAKRSYNEIHHLGRFVQQQVPEVVVMAQNVNSSEGNVILGQKDFFLTEQRLLTERIGDISFRVSPRSFFQVNNHGAELIYSQVREWAQIDSTETVLDLYCGIGGIGLFLARQARQVIGVEVVEEAVADAAVNARLNGIANCRYEAGDAADLLRELAEDGEKVDVAILNPPRKGCDQKVLERVAALEPRAILYVSCSPQSLARDLSELYKLGYVCREIQPVDMFPQTIHVENVARLEKISKSA